MKKTILAAMMLVPSLAMGYATYPDGTEVGDLDIFLGSIDTLDNSNPETETEWLQSFFPDSEVLFEFKNEPVEYFYATDDGSEPLDGEAVIAFSLTPFEALEEDPLMELFIVKNARYWAAFENVFDINWGVIDTEELPAGMNFPPYMSPEETIAIFTEVNGDEENEMFISHVSVFSGGGEPEDPPEDPPNGVPVPAPLALLGIGLIGLIGSRKFIK
jgi:hypothetical protein